MHIATALGHAVCTRGRRVLFYGINALVPLLLEAHEERQLQHLQKQFEYQRLLILDQSLWQPTASPESF